MDASATMKLVQAIQHGSAPDAYDARRERVAELTSAYGQLLPSTSDSRLRPSSVAAVRSLMTEWNPIGYPADSLRVLLGEPTSSSAGELMYRYDTGRAAPAWRFFVSGDIITGVVYHPGE